MELFTEVLLNAGPIGLLALYAIYSNHQSEKRIEELLSKSEIKEDKIRERWLEVVKKLEGERDKLERDMIMKLNELNNILIRIERVLDDRK